MADSMSLAVEIRGVVIVQRKIIWAWKIYCSYSFFVLIPYKISKCVFCMKPNAKKLISDIPFDLIAVITREMVKQFTYV